MHPGDCRAPRTRAHLRTAVDAIYPQGLLLSQPGEGPGVAAQSHCLLAASDTAERKRYGITDEVLAGQHEMSDECRQRLKAVVEAAGGTVEKVCRSGGVGDKRKWDFPH